MASGNARERTSLILTVRNEIGSIDTLLESIACQTEAPDEVVITDGGSTDGTPEALRRWSNRLPIRVEESPGANIAEGRNHAIQHSTGDLIAVTDAGVRLDPRWLERLRAALTPDVDVVSGFFEPDPRSAFERALGATTLPALDDIKPDSFLPSSRSVLFRRRAWQKVGGYPAWLDYCEDLVFDLALRRSGCRFAFAPQAIAWFRPRRSIAAFFRQYFFYARGDGKADLWPSRHAVRYAVYAVTAAIFIWWRRLWWLSLVGAAAYVRRPVQRLDLTGLSVQARVCAVLSLPVIRLVGDIAKMLGYPVGRWWRIRRTWTSRSSS